MVARVFDVQHPEGSEESLPSEAPSELRKLLQVRAQPQPAAPLAEAFLSPRVGRILSVSERSEVYVTFAGAERPTPARLAIAVSLDQLERACVERQEVLIVFDGADRDKPIITGLISAPTPAPAADRVDTASQGLSIEADADGRRLRLSAREEITFQCGKASLTLTSAGRVIVRGAYVETYASGTNRIKGGQVRIN